MNAGISLAPKFIEQARDYATAEGFGNLTNLVRHLLVQFIQETNWKYEAQDIEREKLKSAPVVPAPKKRGRPRKHPL
jgi:hypothetical protein